MPIIKSAKKAARQSVKRTAHNQQIKRTIKAALKEFKANPTDETLRKVQSEYDKAVKKGLLKKNTASRRKSSLVKLAKALSAEAAKPKTVAKTAKKAAKPAKKAAVKTAKSSEKAVKASEKAADKKPATKAPAKKPAAKKAPAPKKAEKATEKAEKAAKAEKTEK